jgi:hypothetical protein
MTVFEDLIEELKEENLLESTVIDPAGGSSSDATSASDIDVPSFERPVSPRDFYRKRAEDEVSSLQMVQHVLMGVEREHMKTASIPFNDLKVKKALHVFLQESVDPNSAAAKEAEFDLMNQTQDWFASLAERDKEISVANVRRFCENSRPVLSSQALIALARFYRNAPFTEDVRSKFDFVITRLFSKDLGEGKRRLLFERKDAVGHIKTLYENWSSVEIFSGGEHSSEIAKAVAQFDEAVNLADDSKKLDNLLSSGVFDQIRGFKEQLGEMFYAPEVAAAAMNCNIRLGNRFVELVAETRSQADIYALEKRYGTNIDEVVSYITGKSVDLENIVGSRIPAATASGTDHENRGAAKPDSRKSAAASGRSWGAALGFNKWLAAAAVLLIAASVGIYLWADMMAESGTAAIVAEEMDLSSTDLNPHLRQAKLSKETLYAVTEPSWDALSEDEKKEFLKKVVAFAEDKGLQKVNLLNYKGRTVAFSDKYRFEVLPPS